MTTQFATITNTLDDGSEIHLWFSVVNSDEGVWSSDITDHYVEDGTAVQDNIVIQPVEFTISGFVGEQVFVDSLPNVTSKISEALSKLKPIAAFAPIVSNYSKAVVNASYFIENTISNFKNKIFFKDSSQKSKVQTVVAEKLAEMQEARKLVTLSCDLGDFENMAIKSIRLKQEDTTMQSDLVIELKQIRFVESYLTTADAKKYAGRCKQQRELQENLGRVQGKRISTMRSVVSSNIVPMFTGL